MTHFRDYVDYRQSPSLNRVKSALRSLIDESVTIIREVAAEFERPVML
ncbi:MAG: sulfate adenylyltransferase small subunit, partial [Acidimicrobiia bacterium]|nr:sulfate adenylyltransferase small subunit [Acidimicrobiia bacterium]